MASRALMRQATDRRNPQTHYLAVPALPAEQQDPRLNPTRGPLGWVVVRADDEVMVPFGDGYMSQRVACPEPTY
jgi:hypothetical protein